MQTQVNEIADGVYRLSTCVMDAAPGGFTFNQVPDSMTTTRCSFIRGLDACSRWCLRRLPA